MKKNLLFTLLIMLSILVVKGQQPIVTEYDSVLFGETNCPGIWVTIPETSLADIQKDWKKVLEKGTKSKVLGKENEMTIFGAQWSDISGEPVNVFSNYAEKDSAIKLFVAVELQRDEFVTRDSPQYTALNNMLISFAKDKYISVAEEQLSQENKKLKDLQKNLESLRKNKDKLENQIKSDQITIDQENYRIVNTQKEINETDQLLDLRGTELASLDGKERKDKESEIKSLEKKKKNSQKNIASSESKISKSTNNIADNNNAIAINLKEQSKVMGNIADQTMVVRKYEEKLNKIKAY
ncbi:MAG: hypothetical protein KUL83_02935 [Lentimicrobium sp.]|jgi:septal ring factor EnvC (AmiA/AmiB activator)|nr:hypothetical protein [Lentimicrobium sp.]MDD2527248.1 hypothetical protein [Lentimicrobiaceae bacterium]MDY0024867.1 hypothetical protein [Lentimicrobium sp.]HAH58035.1 hypothetical protein [Bacteroidales bacterium]